jgi:hypothetical protein
MSRRDLLRSASAGSGGALIFGDLVSGGEPPRSTPLATPDFYWGIGIENCWIAQTNPERDGNRRLLDVFA